MSLCLLKHGRQWDVLERVLKNMAPKFEIVIKKICDVYFQCTVTKCL